MNESKKEYFGQCLCGVVQYKVTKMEPKMAHCHCSMCRKFHGAAFATYGEAKPENFQWLSGESSLGSYSAANNTVRRFCKHCGSSMTFSSSKTQHNIEFALGTLDTPVDQMPDAHIYIAYKANWIDIHDEIPVYQEGRED